MKKLLALILALALCTAFVAAVPIEPVKEPAAPDNEIPAFMYFGDETAYVTIEPSADFVVVDDAFATKVGDTKYEINYEAASSNKRMLSASISAKVHQNGNDKGAKLILELTPAKTFFTVEETEVKVTIGISQKTAGEETVKKTADFKITVSNRIHCVDDFWELADGSYSSFGALTYPVVDVSVFDAARGDKLALDYGDYTITFGKVKNQKTSLYMKGETGTIDSDGVIASIAFSPTRVKDAVTITAPVSADDENYYGDYVYVYAVDNGKPKGDAITAEIVDHRFLVFGVPAGSVLGSYAAYGDDKYGLDKAVTTEKPSIPETGADKDTAMLITIFILLFAGLSATALYLANKITESLHKTTSST